MKDIGTESKRKKAEYLGVTKNNEHSYLSEDWKKKRWTQARRS